MSAQHTPGPWVLATSNSWRRILGERGFNVCTPITQSDGHPDLWFANGGENGPDARLILAAPELVEALRATYDALCVSYPLHSSDMDKRGAVLGQARAAIAKAEGKS